MTDGLIREYEEIIGCLNAAHKLLNETGLLGDLEPQVLMATTCKVERAREMACRLVDTHEANELGLFALLKKGLLAE